MEGRWRLVWGRSREAGVSILARPPRDGARLASLERRIRRRDVVHLRDRRAGASANLRPSMRRTAALAAVLLLVVPGVAAAQSGGANPFGPLPVPQPQQPGTTTAPSPRSSSSSG